MKKLKLISLFSIVFMLLFCESAYAGFLDSIKKLFSSKSSKVNFDYNLKMANDTIDNVQSGLNMSKFIDSQAKTASVIKSNLINESAVNFGKRMDSLNYAEDLLNKVNDSTLKQQKEQILNKLNTLKNDVQTQYTSKQELAKQIITEQIKQATPKPAPVESVKLEDITTLPASTAKPVAQSTVTQPDIIEEPGEMPVLSAPAVATPAVELPD